MCSTAASIIEVKAYSTHTRGGSIDSIVKGGSRCKFFFPSAWSI